MQFDFEGIAIADKEALTNFYTEAANAFHKQGMLVSFAVVPVEEGSNPSTTFLKRKYDNWGGSYDLQRLAPVADFITIMAYDQHNEGATPGPTASLTWVKATLQYALQFIPASKISLGIPAYSNYWYTAARSDKLHARISMRLDSISYDQLIAILKKNHAHLQWDNQHKLHYAIYEHHWLYEYLFAEDAQSFKAKRALARKYHLRGISVFALGNEDKRIWKVLAS